MPRKCGICAHEKREEIDKALLNGDTLRNIAQKHGVSLDMVNRHKKNHVAKRLAKAAEAKDVAAGGTLLDQLDGLKVRAASILDKAEDAGTLHTAISAIREMRGIVETYARISGELQETKVQINIIQHPLWKWAYQTFMKTLRNYPGAIQVYEMALEQKLLEEGESSE
jgi:hypothetical protein